MTWTGNNRTHMVRVPGPGRFELRLPDGAVNPYLLQAVIIAAGLSASGTRPSPGKRHDIDMYADGHKVRGAPKLPLNLLDALRTYDRDKALKRMMGEDFSAAFLKMKHREWQSFVSHFSCWEREHTLDVSDPGARGWRPEFSQKILRRENPANFQGAAQALASRILSAASLS